ETAQWRTWVNERVRPVAWLVHRVRVVGDDEALRLVRGDGAPFAPDEEALASEPLVAEASAEPGTVTVVGYDADAIALRAGSPAAGVLVTSELAYPGWTATVDGRDAAVRTVDFGFRAVEVPAGTHDVVFRYRPRRGRIGLALGGIGAIAILAGAVLRRR